MAKGMNKFEQDLNLSNKGIKAKRSKLISEDGASGTKKVILDYEEKVRNLKKKQAKLEDLNAENSDSLYPVRDLDFNGEQWARDMISTQIELDMAKMELKIARKMETKYFTVEENVEIEKE